MSKDSDGFSPINWAAISSDAMDLIVLPLSLPTNTDIELSVYCFNSVVNNYQNY